MQPSFSPLRAQMEALLQPAERNLVGAWADNFAVMMEAALLSGTSDAGFDPACLPARAWERLEAVFPAYQAYTETMSAHKRPIDPAIAGIQQQVSEVIALARAKPIPETDAASQKSLSPDARQLAESVADTYYALFSMVVAGHRATKLYEANIGLASNSLVSAYQRVAQPGQPVHLTVTDLYTTALEFLNVIRRHALVEQAQAIRQRFQPF